jgi:riboflavin kinase/FMN adenylyltransferase
MNIGNRPTLNNGSQRSIEVHIIGFHDDIYEEIIHVSFLGFLRQQCKFPSVEALRQQIAADRDEVVRRFSIHP